MDTLTIIKGGITDRAFSLLSATLDGMQPAIDLSPEAVDQAKENILEVFLSICRKRKFTSNALLGKILREEADDFSSGDLVLESELRSLSILIEHVSLEQR
jgi:hypothetical protein